MIGGLLSTFWFTLQFALLVGLYGLVVGALWTPFLLAARMRALFRAIPPRDWRLSYVVWIPVPAVIWAILFAVVLSVSADLRQPTAASPLYVGGVDGIVVATIASLILWPIVLLHVLPDLGIEWFPAREKRRTLALVVVSLAWYLLFLVGPAYALSVFAGFGDAMSGG